MDPAPRSERISIRHAEQVTALSRQRAGTRSGGVETMPFKPPISLGSSWTFKVAPSAPLADENHCIRNVTLLKWRAMNKFRAACHSPETSMGLNDLLPSNSTPSARLERERHFHNLAFGDDVLFRILPLARRFAWRVVLVISKPIPMG